LEKKLGLENIYVCLGTLLYDVKHGHYTHIFIFIFPEFQGQVVFLIDPGIQEFEIL